MVERGARGRTAARSTTAGEGLTPVQRERRRLWIVLGRAINMAVAGALAGAGVQLDGSDVHVDWTRLAAFVVIILAVLLKKLPTGRQSPSSLDRGGTRP